MQGKNRDSDIVNRLMDTAGEGEGETNSDSSTETYQLPYVKQVASGKLLYSTRELSPVPCDDLKGWVGSSRERACVHVYG